MKVLRLFFCVLLVFALSLGVFSITASAESDVSYNTAFTVQWMENNVGMFNKTYNVGNPGNVPLAFQVEDRIFTNQSYFVMNIAFTAPDDEIIIKSGETFNLRIGGFTPAYRVYDFHNTWTFFQNFNNISVRLTDTSGVQHTLSGAEYSFSGTTTLGTFSLPDTTVTYDVTKVTLILRYIPTVQVGVTGEHNLGFTFSVHETMFPTLSLDIASDEESLLSGILAKIKDLFSKTEENTENVKKGFKDIISSITQLPQKIWDLIANGLKNLFVPDQEYMAEYSDEWDELLSSRFGAIYQSGQIIQDFGESLDTADETDTIYMPEVSLETAGIPFTFGGYDVQIVPTGFKKYVGVVEGLISIVCTFMFVNGLRKRYDEVMGVKS